MVKVAEMAHTMTQRKLENKTYKPRQAVDMKRNYCYCLA